jgi:hypothetical protein
MFGRRERDARRQSKADALSIGTHKETMLGLLRASVSNKGDSPEQSIRRRFAAGDPTAIPSGSDGKKKSPTINPTPRDSGGHVELK